MFGICLEGRLYYPSPFTVEETETQIDLKVSYQKYQWRWDLKPSDFELELLKPECFPFCHVVFLRFILSVGQTGELPFESSNLGSALGTERSGF